MELYEQVTSIFDEDGEGFFNDVAISDISVSLSNEYSKHTLEDGTAITDNFINNQPTIQLTGVVQVNNFADIYKQIDDSRANGKSFTIQTKVDSYENMYITKMSYQESSKINRTVIFNISFIKQQTIQVKKTTLKKSSVKSEKDASTKNAGTQTGNSVDDKSLICKLMDLASSSFCE